MVFLRKFIFSLIFFSSILGFSLKAQVIQDKKIETVMDLKKEYQKLNPKIDGFKVQLYNGNEKDSYDVKNKFLTLFPDIKVEIIFKTPEWKVQVGNYRTRLEADKSLLKIKDQFPGSIVVQAKINP